MRATCFLLAATTALCACLDFDVFDTEPTTGSTSSTGGAGGAGGDGGAGTTTSTMTTTATGMGGQGGMGGTGGGGGPPAVPACGTYTDDFDGATPDLAWDFQGPTSFSNDRAVASPPNGSFWFWDDPTLTLDECAVSIDVVTDTDQTWFFGWTDLASSTNVLRALRNQQKELHVVLTGGNPADVIVATNVTTTRVRIRMVGGDYLIETAPVGTNNWTTQHTVTAATAPAWLTMPGYPWFGAQGSGSGTNVEFDSYGAP